MFILLRQQDISLEKFRTIFSDPTVFYLYLTLMFFALISSVSNSRVLNNGRPSAFTVILLTNL
jgi:hypothetical protein